MKKKLAIIPVALLLIYGGVATAEKTAKCPISGKAANPKISFEVNGKAVSFCCNNCKKSYSKTIVDKGPGKCQYSGKAAKKSTGLIHETSQLVSFCCNNCAGKYAKANKFSKKTSKPGKCPISGKAANPATQVVHTTRETKYFCCNKCKGKYAKANFK